MQDIYQNKGTGIASLKTGEYKVFTIELNTPVIENEQPPEVYAISFWVDLNEAETREQPPSQRQILVAEVPQIEPDKIDSIFAATPFELVGETLDIGQAEVIGQRNI